MLVLSHEAAGRHLTPPGHPERVERVAAVERGLAGLVVERRVSPLAGDVDLLRCHPAAYPWAVVVDAGYGNRRRQDQSGMAPVGATR